MTIENELLDRLKAVNELLDRLKAVLQAKDEEIEALKLANKLQRERFDSTIAEIVDAQQRVHSLLTTLGLGGRRH